MTATVPAAAVPAPVRWKRIVLPPEHGAWAFLLEPVIVALVLVPSIPGLAVALSALAAFLARNPLRIVSSDRRLEVRSQRTRSAERAAVALSAGALASLATAVASGDTRLLIPVAAALPIALVQQRLESMRRSRELAAELSGTLAIGAVASVIVLAGGGSGWLALSLWTLLSCRSIPAVLYVRNRIALEKRGVSPSAVPVVAHVIAVGIGAVLLLTPAGSAAAAVVLGLLLVRCLIGISPRRRRVSAKRIGIAEMGWGAIMVLALVLF